MLYSSSNLVLILFRNNKEFYVATWPYHWIVLDGFPQLLVLELTYELFLIVYSGRYDIIQGNDEEKSD